MISALEKWRGLGHNRGVGRRQKLHEATLVLAAWLVLPGCIEFGGPLVGEGDEQADDETDTETDTGTDTEAGTDTGEERCGPSVGEVAHVVDGDTVVLTTGDRVRYILVDTPEVTKGKNECWGSQATDHNASLVLNRTISLTYDVECEDIYGRLLAYVTVGDVEVNRTLLESGDACYLHVPPNGDGRAAEYQALETAAKEGGIGMWGACGTILCD